MAFNTKVDVADTELEADETVAAEAEDVTLEDGALVEAEPTDDADEDDEEADESEDSLTYSNGVIEKIVAMATREVPHVLGMKGNLMHFVQEQFGAENLTKGVQINITDEGIDIDLFIIVEYGISIVEVCKIIKSQVCYKIENMTGARVRRVNISVEGIRV